jgi:hypothetical protein
VQEVRPPSQSKGCCTGCVERRSEQDRQCAYKRDIKARSRNHCCRARAKSIMYSQRVFVALNPRQANALYYIIICVLPRSTIFFTHYLINGTIFEEKELFKIRCVFWFYLQLLSETFLVLSRTERDMIKNVYRAAYKVPVIVVRFW